MASDFLLLCCHGQLPHPAMIRLGRDPVGPPPGPCRPLRGTPRTPSCSPRRGGAPANVVTLHIWPIPAQLLTENHDLYPPTTCARRTMRRINNRRIMATRLKWH